MWRVPDEGRRSCFAAYHGDMYPYEVYNCWKTDLGQRLCVGHGHQPWEPRKHPKCSLFATATVAHVKCHITSDILGSKPGGLPIFHVLPDGHPTFYKVGNIMLLLPEAGLWYINTRSAERSLNCRKAERQLERKETNILRVHYLLECTLQISQMWQLDT